MELWGPLTFCILCLCALGALGGVPPDLHPRIKRQEPAPEAEAESEDYAVDYAGNDNNDDPPKPEPADTITDTQNDFNEDRFGRDNDFNDNKFGQNDDLNEDKFGTDNFDDSPKEEKKESRSRESDESKPKKKVKKHKYLKKTIDFLKRVLDPNKLMENAYVTEMLRRFSHHEEPEYEEKESLSSEEKEIHTPKPKGRRRGRPKKKDKIPPGITGILKKGMMTLTQLELDKKKLRRRVKLIKKIARKAKKPLKTAVKIFLSSRNQGVGGYGGGGFANNNY